MICENCGKEHDGSYGSGRFCSSTCARKFSSNSNNKGKSKTGRCKNCGKSITIHSHSSSTNIYCDECRMKLSWHKCRICGTYHCSNEFCKTHNLSSIKSLIKFGLNKNTIGTLDIFNEVERVKTILLNLYIGSELSTIEIAHIFNCKVHTVGDVFKSLGINLRNLSDSTLLAIKHNRKVLPSNTYLYKDEWHKTWDGEVVYLRSSYETDFANELDLKHIHYEVENLKIPYFDTQLKKTRLAIPDFYIPSENTIYEIKSTYTYDPINMADKFAEYRKLGYKCVLVLEHKIIA